QTQYVDTFDVTRKCSLHLTYFTDGDTRKRGVSLVQFKQAYRRGGVVLADEQAELPDHLCVLLEFCAAYDPDGAWRLLNDHRVGIELLYRALEQRESLWRHAVQALRATLPELAGDDEQALRRLIAEGPPTEQVGLDSAPYAAFDPALDEPAQRHPLALPPGMAPPGGVAANGRVADLGASSDVGAPRCTLAGRGRPAAARPCADRHPPADLARSEPGDEHPAVDRVPLRLPGRVHRRARLAVPVRQVRLDHPLLPAV